MTITDLGQWQVYIPVPWPDNNIPRSVIFCKRVSDGMDWYKFQKTETFPDNSVFATVADTVLTVTRDISRVWPANLTFLTWVDDTTDDLQAKYVGKIFENGAFVDPPAPVPASISDRQFFQQLAIAGIISEADALASNAAVIPPPLLAIISNMPADQQFPVKMIVSGATIFHRDNPITNAIGTAYGWSSAQIDDFFRAAALL